VIGTTIGNYEVQRLIAQGGMGKVYLAFHPGIGRQAAVKVLPASESADPEIVSRFITEARAAGAIRHPNIVDIYDSGVTEDGSPYIVMEYLEGETLKQALDHGPIALDDVLDWGGQVANALAAAHAQGVLHRDLTANNLFLVSDPQRPGRKQMKVLDFGIAKLQRPAFDQVHKTRTGVLLGTPLYMSPEQCHSPKDVDARSDIYSLGVILYEMATGKPPFDGNSIFIVISRHINDPPVAPTTCRPDLPLSIEAIILQSLAKDPTQRQTSMVEVLTQLVSARREHAVGKEVPGTSQRDQLKSACTVKTFGRDLIAAFLAEIDNMLHEPVVMEIVGGAAALLVHGARSETKDINSLSAFDQRLLRLAPFTTHKIPMEQATVPYAPSVYEERRYRPDLPFRNLVLWVPERHDILLMKALRAAENDLQVIKEMHKAKPFHLETIIERYNDEMGQAVRALGGHPIFDQRIRRVLEMLFGGKYVRGSGRLTMQ